MLGYTDGARIFCTQFRDAVARKNKIQRVICLNCAPFMMRGSSSGEKAPPGEIESWYPPGEVPAAAKRLAVNPVFVGVPIDTGPGPSPEAAAAADSIPTTLKYCTQKNYA